MAHHYWRRAGHVPVMIVLQIIFIILFAIFVIYNPKNAQYGKHTNANGREIMKDYPRELTRRGCRRGVIINILNNQTYSGLENYYFYGSA